MNRTAFRKEVEKILGLNERKYYAVFIDARKVGVRVKYSHVKATKKQMEKIGQLPHVTKVQNWEGYPKRMQGLGPYSPNSYWLGLTIHLDCSTKDVII